MLKKSAQISAYAESSLTQSLLTGFVKKYGLKTIQKNGELMKFSNMQFTKVRLIDQKFARNAARKAAFMVITTIIPSR